MEFKFKKVRRKYSRFLKLHCRVCKKFICTYQKDGPGNLRRLYLDRIFFPKNLVNLQNKPIIKIKKLKCKQCKEELGIPYIYKKENRKAFKLFPEALVKSY